MTELSTNKLNVTNNPQDTVLRVIDIVEGTSVDGPGLRTSIYLAGCAHRCPGCHNPQSWAFDAGHDMTVDEIMRIVVENDFNVTLSGGDPLYQTPAVVQLLLRIRQIGKSVWCFTGFCYEEIARRPDYAQLLELVDVLVDGPFKQSLRDVHLRFRGSSNQRLIDLKRTTPGNIVLWHND